MCQQIVEAHCLVDFLFHGSSIVVAKPDINVAAKVEVEVASGAASTVHCQHASQHVIATTVKQS